MFLVFEFELGFCLLTHLTICCYVIQGLFGRGLRTRILGNAVQSVLFTVIWRGLAERRKRRRQSKKEKQHNANLNKEEGTGKKEEASSSSGVSDDDLGDKVIIDDLYQY